MAVAARAKWTIHDEWMLNRKENQFNWLAGMLMALLPNEIISSQKYVIPYGQLFSPRSIGLEF
ncbi:MULTISPECIES: hypothetical protein [unclassified Endozoicomonas]|uniref:hypothetical protein n=1 Tax=unclassified Endozoicomonas TaxID=2644528 RepID=UPI003BB76ABF